MNPDNPRKITPKSIRDLVKSIEEYGWLQPIIVKKVEEGRFLILDGNHRFQASKFLPPQKIPAFLLPSTLTPEQEFKLIFKINRQYAEYDKDQVKERFKSEFPDLVNVPMFAELGIDFLKPDFISGETPAEMTQNVELDEKLMKYEKLKEAVESILKDTANQIDKSFLMFQFAGNRYAVVLVGKETYLKLRTRQEADPLTFQSSIEDIISSSL